jgi:hypothetical protein
MRTTPEWEFAERIAFQTWELRLNTSTHRLERSPATLPNAGLFRLLTSRKKIYFSESKTPTCDHSLAQTQTLMNALSLPPLAALGELLPFAGMLIGIIAIVTPFAFVIAIVAINHVNARRKAELRHETIRLALEKGQPLPPELLNMPATVEQKPKSNDRKAGLILIAVGVGLYFFFSAGGWESRIPGNLRWVALIPGLIGVALLINWFFERGGANSDKN